jgi:hypothetical protein
MTHLTTLHALAAALLLISAHPARADFCPAAPGNAWPSGPAQYRCNVSQVSCTPATEATDCGPGETCVVTMNATYDDQLISKWCGTFHSLWNGLHIESEDWDEGHGAINNGGGWQPTCAPDDHLTRLFNAGQLVKDVTEYALPYGFHRTLADPDNHLNSFDVDQNDRFLGNWWSFVVFTEPDEWVPGCGNGNTMATNVSGIDDYIELHKASAYRRTALARSSTIVHETAHEDVGHIDDEDCIASGSCDERYGKYNAQTMQIDYLYDAATAYQTALVNSQLVRTATNFIDPDTGIRMCTYIPVFTEFERDNALSTANRKYNRNFQDPPLRSLSQFSDADAADGAMNATWECDQCQVSDWNFDPNQCEQTACNELLAATNAAVNDHNFLECLDYNTEVISGGFSQEAIAQAEANRNYQNCHVPQTDAVIAFCASEKATANHVSEIDSCGWLEGVYVPGFSKTICIQEFCHERFEADQGIGWSPGGDPYGCLDAICAPDGESCNDDLPQAQCRQLFVAAHGHPDYYAASCTIDGCQRARATCLANVLAQDPNAWEYPEPVPAHCDLIYDLCELAKQLSAEVLISLEDLILKGRIIGTGPVEQTINPGFFLEDILIEYELMMDQGAGSDELQGLLSAMLTEPEMLQALFHLAPERFVALFGTEGFEEFIGPRILDVTPQPIAASDLSPRGQQALLQLEELIAETPPEDFHSPFGTTIHSQLIHFDRDNDGINDAGDSCPDWSNSDQLDADGNGIGDECECGDQNGDGTVDVSDLLAINAAIFDPSLATPLCDTNDDDLCDVQDIIGANAKLFGAPAYCARYPAP